MSSRALRKLQESRNQPEDDEEIESEEEVRSNKNQKGFNAFMLLNESCSESEVKEDDDLESEITKDPPVVPHAEKKKRKRKKKTGKKPAVASSEDNIEKKDELDEIDAAVKWVEANDTSASVSLPSGVEQNAETAATRKILLIENKYLNPENEMKRIFGSRVVASENQNARQKKGRGGRGGQVLHRSTLLITPKPSWPSGARTGLSMRPIESDVAGSWFTYDHSPSYQQVQMRFLSAVESLNPDSIVAILNNQPMHIDSLLQLSDICKMGDDSAMAAELVERAIYALESSFHPCFNLASGTCHLDYKRQENRAIFIALFRHLHNVGSRACYRTALEICKVLMNLDPSSDPLAMILLVDFYALRSRSFQWLVDFYNIANPSRNLSQMPNFSYSVALATFHLFQESNQQDHLDKADSLLQEALLSFPSVLLSLLDKCSIEPDPSVMKCQYFLDSRSDPPALAALCSLYVSRCYHCWKEPELLPWLEKNVKLVVERVIKDDPRVAESKTERSTRYQGMPRNIHRHVIMSDNNKDALSHLPAELKDVAILAWDPLPPLNSINTYVTPDRQPSVIDDPSALRMFFRSLLPNFNPADPAAAAEAVDGAAAAVAAGGEHGGTELRNSVHSLLDAMRDLLGNIQLPEHPVEGGDDDDPWEEGEWD